MKRSTLTLVALLLFCNLMLAHNGDPKPAINSKSKVIEDVGVSLKDIFLADYEGVVLFIDFQAVKDHVTVLNVLKNDEIVWRDDVQDVPGNTIYELDLDRLETGSYRVELKTEQGISIQKDLVIE